MHSNRKGGPEGVIDAVEKLAPDGCTDIEVVLSHADVDRLKRLVLPGDGALDLDRKMLAVLTRSDQPELFAMLQRLYAAMVVDGSSSEAVSRTELPITKATAMVSPRARPRPRKMPPITAERV